MFIAIITSLITVIGGLIGVWIGGIVSRKASMEAISATHKNAIELIYINNKKFAGLRLREAFSPELSKLQHPEGYGIAEIPHLLEIAFQKHQIAINEFRFFLAGDELISFNKAWNEYYRHPYKDCQNLNKHIALTKEDIKKTIQYIKAILEFTNTT